MMTHTTFPTQRISVPFKLILLALCLLLTACSNNSMQELITYTDGINARPATRIENLDLSPSLLESAIYVPDGRRDPFMPLVIAKSPEPLPVIPPPATHPSEELEAYPLDSMRMVGTLEHEDATLALVRTSDGIIHQVRLGNYLGENNGKVIEISESGIHLTENVLQGNRWQDRPARLALISLP